MAPFEDGGCNNGAGVVGVRVDRDGGDRGERLSAGGGAGRVAGVDAIGTAASVDAGWQLWECGVGERWGGRVERGAQHVLSVASSVGFAALVVDFPGGRCGCGHHDTVLVGGGLVRSAWFNHLREWLLPAGVRL